MSESVAAPDIRVEKGHAEPAELAALVVVLLARAAAAKPITPTTSARRPPRVWRGPDIAHSWQH